MSEGTGGWPGIRALRTGLRTAHLLTFAVLYGGQVYDVAPERLHAALLGTVLSGVALAAIDVVRKPIWLVQVRGLATMAKVLLVALVPVWWAERVWLLTATVVIGGVSSHMPGRYRYYSVLHRRVIGSQDRG